MGRLRALARRHHGHHAPAQLTLHGHPVLAVTMPVWSATWAGGKTGPGRGAVCDESAAGWRRGRESPSSAEQRRGSDPPFSQRQSGLAVTHQHLDAHVVGARVKVGPYPAGHLIG
jgi:hypothetical protein